jgi:hypothetical protein
MIAARPDGCKGAIGKGRRSADRSRGHSTAASEDSCASQSGSGDSDDGEGGW